MAIKRRKALASAFTRHIYPEFVSFLTGHLHNVSRDDFSGLDPLHTLSVRTVNLAHLRLVLLESLDGIFSVTLLWHTQTVIK